MKNHIIRIFFIILVILFMYYFKMENGCKCKEMDGNIEIYDNVIKFGEDTIINLFYNSYYNLRYWLCYC